MASGLLSCTDDSLVPQVEEIPASVPMQFDIKVADNAETKATKTNWASGDIIYVFFNGLATKYLILEYNGNTWSNTSGGGDLLNTDFDNLSTKTLTAVHFPVAVDVAFADSKFSFTSGDKPVYNYYLFQAGKSYDVSGTTVSATLSMGKPEGMAQFHVAGIQSNVANYTFGCSKIKPVACTSVGTNGAIIESVLQAGARLSGIADSDGAIFAGLLTTPGVSTDYTFTLATNDKIYTLTRTDRTLTAGKMYNFPLTGSWSSTNASDLYEDLGIIVGGKKIYWAKCNLGAAKPEDYGDYFAWGETTGYNNGKTVFSWIDYRWGDNYNTLTRYCNNSSFGKDGYSDDLTTLRKEDDAAYAALGGKFRMPTSSEIDALLALNKKWVSNYNNSGISGYTFNGNGRTLFLPAAGFRKGTTINNAGSQVGVWSSSLSMGNDYTGSEGHADQPYQAYNLYSLYYYSGNETYKSASDRCYGLSVRPVSE